MSLLLAVIICINVLYLIIATALSVEYILHMRYQKRVISRMNWRVNNDDK